MMDNLVNSSRLPFDIRAEVLARLLAEKYDLSIEQVLFQPRNYFQRWGRRDVLEVSEGYSYTLDKATICLDVCREGLLDILPDGLFSQPDGPYPDNVAKSQALSKQEAAARKLLFPFEQLFYWLRLENEYREHNAGRQLEAWWQNLLSGEGYAPLSDSALNADQKEILTHLLPHLPDIVGNWPLTEQWLSIILQTSVRLREAPLGHYDLPESVQKRMGEGVLGQDFVIGRTYSDGIPGLQISIAGLTPETLSGYLEEGKQRKLLEDELLPLFLPVETPYDISLELKEQSTYFKLGQAFNHAVLGYTTVLGK